MNTKRVLLTALVAAVLFGCKQEEDKTPAPNQGNPSQLEHALGGFGDESFDKVPVSTKYGNTSPDNLPPSVDLSAYLPPIGNQGSYGTCVSWASGYYAKTAIEGIAKGYSASQLSSSAYQISPLDLFTAVANDQKGQNCQGSSLIGNLDVMQQRGVATLNVAPYSNVGDCSQSSTSWEAEAVNHKIKSYRIIDGSIISIKQQLVSKQPVMVIAKLSDNFMSWNSDNVLSSNTTYNQVGEHAYHGLTIVGYDDQKGAGGAFKIVNSWGDDWGSSGFIWIDYNFLLTTFVDVDNQGNKVLMVMNETVTKPTDNPEPQPNPQPNPEPSENGVNLVAWVNQDMSTYESTGSPTSRIVDLNIYNEGSADANPQTTWKASYYYYNAYNANDYGVLFHHTYTTNGIESGKYTCDGGNCTINLPIPAGGNLSEQLFGNSQGVQVPYNMPSDLNGSYYLVLVVDADGAFSENNEADNFFYTTAEPIQFTNGNAARRGYAQQAGAGFSFKNQLTIKSPAKSRSEFRSAIKPGNLNAYSPQEIFSFIRQQKKSGAFAQKLQEHERRNTTQSIRPVTNK